MLGRPPFRPQALCASDQRRKGGYGNPSIAKPCQPGQLEALSGSVLAEHRARLRKQPVGRGLGDSEHALDLRQGKPSSPFEIGVARQRMTSAAGDPARGRSPKGYRGQWPPHLPHSGHPIVARLNRRFQRLPPRGTRPDENDARARRRGAGGSLPRPHRGRVEQCGVRRHADHAANFSNRGCVGAGIGHQFTAASCRLHDDASSNR